MALNTVDAAVAPVRSSSRNSRRTGPLGLEIRLRWGDQIVGEYFLPPGADSAFTVGSAKGVTFAMGDSRLGGRAFQAVTFDSRGASVQFTQRMTGQLLRKSGSEVIPLETLREDDGESSSVQLGKNDVAWVDLGGVILEVCHQPVPKAVQQRLIDGIDFTALNTFLVMLFLGALFVITASNRNLEGDEMPDEIGANTYRNAKVLIKAAEVPKSAMPKSFEKKAEPKPIAKHDRTDGQSGTHTAPKRDTRSAAAGKSNEKDKARQLLSNVFGAGAASNIFGNSGLGNELNIAVGNISGRTVGDAQGFGGQGLHGDNTGGFVGDTIGLHGMNTHGNCTAGRNCGAPGLLTGPARHYEPVITDEPATIIGTLDPELIRQVIHGHRSEIRYCYESQLGRFPKMEGKVGLKFVINGEGIVAMSQAATSTLGNPTVESCISGRARTWVFPKPKGGGTVVVTYPFVFKQSGL